MAQLVRDEVADRAPAAPAPTVPTRLVAIGLIALVAGLMILKVVGLAYREVYPAVIFPGFARLPEGAAESDQEIRVRTIRLTAGDSSLELTADEAFPEPLDSFYLPMLDSLVEAEATPSLRRWADRTWQAGSGDESCVTGLQVLDVVVADESQQEVLADLTFPACAEPDAGS